VILLQGCFSLSSRNSPPLGYTAVAGDLPLSIRTLGADQHYSLQSSGDIADRIQARSSERTDQHSRSIGRRPAGERVRGRRNRRPEYIRETGPNFRW